MAKRIKYGTDWDLEEEADRLLAKSREGVKKHSEKKDYLSPSQLAYRKNREVYNSNGFPDPHLYSGLFRRTYNRSLGDKKKLKGSAE